MNIIRSILDKAETLFTGEPARIIGYGAAVVVYIVAKAVGFIPDQTPDEALASAVAALAVVATVVESIRHLVYSPATVAALPK